MTAGRAPQFLGKTEKKVSFQEEDSCLLQIDPHAVAFALGNFGCFVLVGLLLPSTQQKSEQSKLEGVRAVGDSAHGAHTEVEYYETLAVFGLLAAAHFGSTQAFVCSRMHGSIQQQLPSHRA